jgi:hypothetical protein
MSNAIEVYLKQKQVGVVVPQQKNDVPTIPKRVLTCDCEDILNITPISSLLEHKGEASLVPYIHRLNKLYDGVVSGEISIHYFYALVRQSLKKLLARKSKKVVVSNYKMRLVFEAFIIFNTEKTSSIKASSIFASVICKNKNYFVDDTCNDLFAVVLAKLNPHFLNYILSSIKLSEKQMDILVASLNVEGMIALLNVFQNNNEEVFETKLQKIGRAHV